MLQEAFLAQGSTLLAQALGIVRILITTGDTLAFLYLIYRLLVAGSEPIRGLNNYRMRNWCLLALVWPLYGWLLLNYLLRQIIRLFQSK